ncbi:MAG: 23S rRNA (pseudouridine(1915)-N(3))-methyltransferase RlmH [Rickettsiales bacterium]
MKILIAAIGKAKTASPEHQLFLDYTKRLPWKVECKEFDVRPADKAKEAEKLLAACEGYDRIIALDETGEVLSSEVFADKMQSWQQKGYSSFAFIIGGADGLDDKVHRCAHTLWSFGKVTWPHMLVRGLLAEQLYRSYSIMTNHPYHRA